MLEGDENQSDEPLLGILVARQLRQRAEALQRAGIEHLPSQIPKGAFLSRKPSVEQRPSPSTVAASPVPVKVPASAPALSSFQSEPSVVKRSPVPKSVTPSPAPPVSAPVSGVLFGDASFDTPQVPADDRPRILQELAQVVSTCTKCTILAATRTQTVFGDGSPTARLMFIGEAPGAEEDKQGVPFVGRSGQLLTDMITKGMGIRREDVYIANILKCRPPDNRNPEPAECANCLPYLERQIETVRPEFICLLGRIAALNLLQTTVPLGKLRGRWHQIRGIKTLVTYHPSYLLRNPPAKKDAWEDLQIIMKEMGLTVPARKKE